MLHVIKYLSQFSLTRLIDFECQHLDCFQVNSMTALQYCYQGNICSSFLKIILVKQAAYVFPYQWNALELRDSLNAKIYPSEAQSYGEY
jgi:hypothetical protein